MSSRPLWPAVGHALQRLRSALYGQFQACEFWLGKQPWAELGPQGFASALGFGLTAAPCLFVLCRRVGLEALTPTVMILVVLAAFSG